MSLNVETIGGGLMVQHYVETFAEKHQLILEPVSDMIIPTGRTTIPVIWELMSVRSIDDRKCRFSNQIRFKATEEFKSFLDRQGIPFDVFRTATAHVDCSK